MTIRGVTASGELVPFDELPVDGGVVSVELADMDGDGDKDLIVAARSSERGILLFENRGDGQFPTVKKHRLAGEMTMMSVIDVDGNGTLDVAASIEYPESVSILLNDGKGNFTESPAITWAQTIFSPAVYMAVGNFDGSGLPDVMVGSYDQIPTMLFLNQGGGRYSNPIILGGISLGYIAKAVDIDGDGLPEVITSDRDGLLVHRNKGGGKFDVPTKLLTEMYPMSLEIADIDGDGTSDLIVSCQGVEEPQEGGLSVFLEDGKGGFRGGITLCVGYWPGMTAAGDFDHNGSMDLAVATEGLRNFFPGSVSVVNISAFPAVSTDCDRNGVPDECQADCNRNGRPDACDIASGLSKDIKGGGPDGIPDECQPTPFQRGDANGDAKVNVADPIWILNVLFFGGPASPCQQAADANDDDRVSISDAMYVIEYYFQHGPKPGNPFPACGGDPTQENLSCDSYLPCE